MDLDQLAVLALKQELEDAWPMLIEEAWPGIIGYCTAMAGTEKQDANSMANEVFARMWDSRKHWREEEGLKRWMFTIASNVCATARKSAANRKIRFEVLRTVLEPVIRTAKAPSAEEQYFESSAEGLLDSLSDEELLSAVTRLHEKDRALISLRHWADMSPKEISERLGIAEGTVRAQLTRAHGRLRKILAPQRPLAKPLKEEEG